MDSNYVLQVNRRIPSRQPHNCGNDTCWILAFFGIPNTCYSVAQAFHLSSEHRTSRPTKTPALWQVGQLDLDLLLQLAHLEQRTKAQCSLQLHTCVVVSAVGAGKQYPQQKSKKPWSLKVYAPGVSNITLSGVFSFNHHKINYLSLSGPRQWSPCSRPFNNATLEVSKLP